MNQPGKSLIAALIIPASLLTEPRAAYAQVAPSTETSPAVARNEQTPVEMSPFEVSGDAVRGYATTSSTAASRVAVPVTELATSIITINEQLIADTLAVTPDDVLNLVGGLSTFNDSRSQDGSSFALRGYTQVGAQRDGFDDLLFGSNGGFNFAFLDRLEVSKGPSGSLNGEVNPGGTLNLVSKRPLAKKRTKVSLMVGSFDFYQADLDNSGPVGSSGKLAYRLSASYRNTDGPLRHPGESGKGFLAINPSLRYRFDNGWETWLWTGFIRDGSPRLRPLVRGFQTADNRGAYLLSLAHDPGVHNVLTNRQEVNTDNYEVGATRTFNFGSVRMDLKLLARYIDQLDTNKRVRTTSASGTDTFVSREGVILGNDSRNIDYNLVKDGIDGFFRNRVIADGTERISESKTFAADFNFSYKIGPTNHRTLVSINRNDAERLTSPGLNGVNYTITSVNILRDLGVEVVGNTARVWLYPFDRNVLVGIDPERVAEVANSVANANITNQDSRRDGFSVNERMFAFDNRLVLSAGARYTDTSIVTQTGSNAPVDNRTSDWSTSFSALYKYYKGELGEMSVYVSKKDTFIPVFTIDRRLATEGQKFPNRTALEDEVGLKFDIWNSRVVATVAAFDKVEDNVLIPEVDIDGSITGLPGQSYQSPVGERTARGWDLDISANITRGLNTVVGYGHVREAFADGTPRNGRSANTWSALARYEVQSGPLKNASLLWQYTWWGASRLNNRTFWSVPPGDLHTVVLGYRWKDYAFRLRIENPFDTVRLRPSNNETAVGITAKRNWRLAVERTW